MTQDASTIFGAHGHDPVARRLPRRQASGWKEEQDVINPRPEQSQDPQRGPETPITTPERAEAERSPVTPPAVSSPGGSSLPYPAVAGAGPSPVPYNAQPGAGPQVFISAKNPAVHLIVSLFLPGVGSMMSGRTGIG